MTASPVLDIAIERWPLAAPFRIAGRVTTGQDVVVATLRHDGVTGRGEAAGIFFAGETAQSVAADLRRQVDAIRTMDDCETVLRAMPPGGARNALDCAWWEWRARTDRTSVTALLGLPVPVPIVTHYTIGADTPAAMASRAATLRDARALKLKLVGDHLDGDRVRAARAARPDTLLSVDGNQGLDVDALRALLPICIDAKVALVEQPLPVGAEAALASIPRDIPLAADESARTRDDLARLRGSFDIVNIKLDKTGGLTAALDMAHAARAMGFGLMVGNMIGTSLAMAPAFLVGQLCDHVDLDGPTLLASDRAPAVLYREDGTIWCGPEVWG